MHNSRPPQNYPGGYQTNISGNYHRERGPDSQGGNYVYQQPGEYRGELGPQYRGQNRYEPAPRPGYFNQLPREGFPMVREKRIRMPHSRRFIKTPATPRSPSNLIGSNDQIVNLSSRALTEDERRPLGLDLKFIQVPCRKNILGAVNNLIRYRGSFRKIYLAQI